MGQALWCAEKRGVKVRAIFRWGRAVLVSHKYKFIFLRTQKTASTSIAASLARYCDGPDDIIAPSRDPDAPLEGKNHKGWFNPFPELGGRDRIEILNIAREFVRRQKFRDHTDAVKARNRLGPDVWDSYYKFCFERNPFDKTVSYYWWMMKRWTDKDPKAEISFEDFVRRRKLPRDFYIYSIDDAVAVNHVAHFENLQEELKGICARLKIPYDGWLPASKSKIRKDRDKPVGDYYNAETAAIIEHAFEREIALMGYRSPL